MHIARPTFRAALALTGLLTLTVTAQAREDRNEQEFVLLNATTWQLSELYVSPAVSPSDFTEDWGVNLVGTAAMEPNQGRHFAPTGNGTSCEYDVRIIYHAAAFEEAEEMFYIDLCENDTIYVDNYTTDWDLIWSRYSADHSAEEVEA